MTAQAIAGTCSGKGLLSVQLSRVQTGGAKGTRTPVPALNVKKLRSSSPLPTRLNAAKPPQTTGQLWPIKSI